MTAGFGLLRLPSAAFWALTPRELGAALDSLEPRCEMPPDRAGLDALMRRFPDRID